MNKIRYLQLERPKGYGHSCKAQLLIKGDGTIFATYLLCSNSGSMPGNISFQRIERYAASVRGYTRLRLERFFIRMSDGAYGSSVKKEVLRINVEEKEEIKGSTRDEEVEGESKYNDSNQTDVGLWPNIDFVKLDLNSKVPNTAYRKDEVEWIIERFRE
ncbi:hypothetical protein HZH66_014783 [Vespula vulgaris]|uniref:Uncharacterized protein n=1 Tax=Vespula vulgaris TaxID=7454 RepID=A0A834MN16_VESVU|nr:hypothetical protein HZH66_014783 [Vespula vulgaris]